MKTIITILSSIVLFSSSSKAITILTFSGTVVNASAAFNGSTFSGSVSYDETQVTPGTFVELFAPQASLSVTIFGQTFTHLNDAEYPSIPVITFSPTNELALSFVVSESPSSPNPTAINASEITEFTIDIAPSPIGQSSYTATLSSVAAIPEPSGLFLLATGSLLSLRRKRKQH